jgi:hypothetical protein
MGGMRWPDAPRRQYRSTPLIPGILTSAIKQAAWRKCGSARNPSQRKTRLEDYYGDPVIELALRPMGSATCFL